ncbi:hypothetical protein H310_00676 [Aphanomyces invadans]|uniref:Uncharacterized protein n=1 Tax=Aphanomyces invadans TaxID=157072 RepID=A0A024UXF2_9STRA|nr:hypothetical protein H310_00676 [Aphanomyces invadans]ETW10353.1 hypothetical protein H310_00676 [Aphanomyces invadans]|eukprot:XP_008861764.1 hypothetical protein H310_00676 [Aphanomyces invadans]
MSKQGSSTPCRTLSRRQWFYLTKVKKRFYVYDDDEMALHSVKSKLFITYVTFLAAVAARAARTSKNRPKGTMLTAPIAVNGDVYFETVLKKVGPAIQEKMPLGTTRQGVFVQQDNASPHRTVTTSALEARGIAGI